MTRCPPIYGEDRQLYDRLKVIENRVRKSTCPVSSLPGLDERSRLNSILCCRSSLSSGSSSRPFKMTRKLAIGFLGVVSLLYIVLGLLGLLGIVTETDGPWMLAAFGTWFFLVAPLALTETNGIQGSCWQNCNLPTDVVHHAQTFIAILSFLSIFCGALGLRGVFAMQKKQKGGYEIWLGLVILSWTVAAWNLQWSFEQPRGTNPLIGPTSVAWAFLYTIAGSLVLRSKNAER